MKAFRSLLAVLALSFGVTAQAETLPFGTLLSGSFQPTDTFASLSFETTDNLTYTFTLTAFDLDALFTDGAFIGAIAVDSDTNSPIVSNVSGDTVVSVSPGGGPGGNWDFRFDLTGPQQARLTANETVSFDATFDQAVVLGSNSFALHVQGLTDAQGGSAWYVPIPEPETYAMMLAGLGMLGFTAKRRKLLVKS
ncbi:MAG TPA: PEP-CTERM sorting domain-containing protein [Methylophilaceae bacterium]|nr:PEP-CTERM sorting domain-containing protein [Methylophilaceae bacterium]